MRLDKVSIDGFKNLRGLDLDFDERQLTTVLIGQHVAGKSNLIEAITQVCRWVDLRRNEPRFRYRVTYRIQPPGPAIPNSPSLCLGNFPGEPAIRVNGQEEKRTELKKRDTELLPDLLFDYFPGSSPADAALRPVSQERIFQIEATA